MIHSTPGLMKVKNPAKGLSKIFTVIDDLREMDRFDNILFSPGLGLEIRCFNM